MSKWFAGVVAGVVLAAAVAVAEPVATPAGADEARLAAAREMMEVTGVTRQMDAMVEAMTRGFAQGANSSGSDAGKALSADFEKGMRQMMSYKEDMLKDFAQLYAETFTADEMKQVSDFYRSGAGAKFISKTPELMQKGAAIGMKYSERMMKEAKPAP